ncbi:hypothetical protein WOC76_09245 [Methylocystis sp. IM3]|uniref:hypothetical protein n=1 Tax=unclassified Methylocystis TaxID=2625913 RepID=UPI0030FC43A8
MSKGADLAPMWAHHIPLNIPQTFIQLGEVVDQVVTSSERRMVFRAARRIKASAEAAARPLVASADAIDFPPLDQRGRE